jgi:hypothetical protein
MRNKQNIIVSAKKIPQGWNFINRRSRPTDGIISRNQVPQGRHLNILLYIAYHKFRPCGTLYSDTVLSVGHDLRLIKFRPCGTLYSDTVLSVGHDLRLIKFRGCLKSRILSSLRGGTTKQSSNYQPFLDCFTSFAMTGQGFRYTPYCYRLLIFFPKQINEVEIK